MTSNSWVHTSGNQNASPPLSASLRTRTPDGFAFSLHGETFGLLGFDCQAFFISKLMISIILRPPPPGKKVKRKKFVLTTASLLANSPFVRIESQLLRNPDGQHLNEWPGWRWIRSMDTRFQCMMIHGDARREKGAARLWHRLFKRRGMTFALLCAHWFKTWGSLLLLLLLQHAHPLRRSHLRTARIQGSSRINWSLMVCFPDMARAVICGGVSPQADHHPSPVQDFNFTCNVSGTWIKIRIFFSSIERP